ncbi:MAG: tRNA 2-thiocytidine biosynthesis protein TtcA [Bacilli bacterium]|nr:tRNA 2-thiocytidine biosynthesis protein TtcA [Bacilli bacterium]
MPMIRSVLAAVKKADETFDLVDPGDVIAIGISGGKDSMCLLYAMHLYTKFSKKDFRIVPITLDLGFPGFDVAKTKEYCKRLGYDLYVSDSTEVYPILLQHTKPGHHVPCSICSRMKKAAINDVAKKLGCNKVAFAHHNDDAIETLMMNMIHGGSVSTFEPKMHLDRADITFVRPFIFVRETQLIELAKEEEIPVMGKTCPADGYTERQFCKDALNDLYEKRPEAIANFQTMLYDYETFRLYYSHVEYPNPFDGHLSLKPLLSAEEAIAYESFAKSHGLPGLESGRKHLLLQKDHHVVGVIAYTLDNPHQITIHDFSTFGINQQENDVFLYHFEAHYCRKINPILFILQSKDEVTCARLGYKIGMPPVGGLYSKRISR